MMLARLSIFMSYVVQVVSRDQVLIFQIISLTIVEFLDFVEA